MIKHQETQPTGAGKSSFGLIDTAKFFHELDLEKKITFMDVACGRGNYSLAVSKIIGRNGRVYAVDLWAEGIVSLRNEAAAKGIQNIVSFVSDASQGIPIENNSVDVCLMATVLHDFVGDKVERQVMKEIVRTVKPNGVLAIVEFYKKEGPPGPPKPVRLSPQDVDKIVSRYGFKQNRLTEIGPDNYLQIFIKKDQTAL
ncbi:MAG: class I SAM-dependent methyltransferase [Desulfobacterales bacterium]|jgi:ubiquinone/menaquinone biosynthesis C-methylase UbiE